MLCKKENFNKNHQKAQQHNTIKLKTTQKLKLNAARTAPKHITKYNINKKETQKVEKRKCNNGRHHQINKVLFG